MKDGTDGNCCKPKSLLKYQQDLLSADIPDVDTLIDAISDSDLHFMGEATIIFLPSQPCVLMKRRLRPMGRASL